MPCDRGMRYGSSKGSIASSAGSPVDESPAACVSVPNAIRRAAMRVEHAPAQGEAGRRRLERGRQTRNRRPGVPDRKRLLQMGVLNGTSVSGESGPDVVRRALELQQDEPWMIHVRHHGRAKRAEQQSIAETKCRRLRPILGPHAEVAFAEDHGDDAADAWTATATRVRRVGLRSRVRSARACREGSPGIVAASLAITTSLGFNRSISRDAEHVPRLPERDRR